jgi:DNA polymerase-1
MTTYTVKLGTDEVTVHAPGIGELDEEAMLDELLQGDQVVLGLDVETTAHETKLNPSPLHRNFRVRTVQLASETAAWVLRLDDPAQRAAAEGLLSLESTVTVCSHTRYDVVAIWREFGLDLTDRWIDTRLLARIADPLTLDRHNKSAGTAAVDIKTLTTKHIGPQLAEFDAKLDERFKALWRVSGQRGAATGQKVTQYGFNTIDVADEVFAVYAGLDAIACRRLYPILVATSRSTPELLATETWLAGAVVRMQMRGMRVDRARLDQAHAEALAACTPPEEKLVGLIGLTPRQAVKLNAWFVENGVVFDEDHPKTQTGKPALSREGIEHMLVRYELTPAVREVAEVLLEYKENENALAKAKEVIGLVDESFDGRLHPAVDSLGAITARMTASAPNIQNYKKEDPRMRATLLPDEGYVLIGADFDQVELRVMAALTREENFLAAIEAGHDLHTMTADKLGIKRSIAKRVNFLQVYGGGAEPLAKATKITLAEAQKATYAYREAYPGVSRYGRSLEVDDHVRTLTHRYIPATARVDRRTGERQELRFRFINYMIQSSSRDLLVLALHRLAEAGMLDMLWIPIHDELILQVPADRVEECMAALQDAMTMDLLGVPITATAVALIDEDGVSRWMTCDRAEEVKANRETELVAA